MGSEDDPMAVVNSKTEVFGVENLRVVDASIMPSIEAAATEWLRQHRTEPNGVGFRGLGV